MLLTNFSILEEDIFAGASTTMPSFCLTVKTIVFFLFGLRFIAYFIFAPFTEQYNSLKCFVMFLFKQLSVSYVNTSTFFNSLIQSGRLYEHIDFFVMINHMAQRKNNYTWWIAGSIGCLFIACIAMFAVVGLTVFFVKNSPAEQAKTATNKADQKIQRAMRTAVSISTSTEAFAKEPTLKQLSSLAAKTKKTSKDAISDLNEAQKLLDRIDKLNVNERIKERASLNSEVTDSLERGFSQYIDWLDTADNGFEFIEKIKNAHSKNEKALEVLFSGVKTANKDRDKSNNASDFKRVGRAGDKALKMFSQAKTMTSDAQSILNNSDAKTLTSSIDLNIKAAKLVQKLAGGDYKDTDKYNKIASQYNALRKRSLSFHNSVLVINNPVKWLNNNILTKTGDLHKSFIEASKARKQATAIDID